MIKERGGGELGGTARTVWVRLGVGGTNRMAGNADEKGESQSTQLKGY